MWKKLINNSIRYKTNINNQNLINYRQFNPGNNSLLNYENQINHMNPNPIEILNQRNNYINNLNSLNPSNFKNILNSNNVNLYPFAINPNYFVNPQNFNNINPINPNISRYQSNK